MMTAPRQGRGISPLGQGLPPTVGQPRFRESISTVVMYRRMNRKDTKESWKWMLALLIPISAIAIRFPDPWAIVGARFALVHLLLVAIAVGVLFTTRPRHSGAALALLAVGLVAMSLPVFTPAARGVQSGLIVVHIATMVLFSLCFLPSSWKERASGVVTVVCLTILLAGLLAAMPSRQAEIPVADKAPFQPSDARSMTGGTLDIEVMNNSALCAGCHADIFLEWQESMHGAADLRDPFYMPAHDLMDEFYGALEPGRYCTACHNPGMLMSGVMVTPPDIDQYSPMRDALPIADKHRHEGVSCLSCHGQVGSDLRGNGSYILTHPEEAWPVLGGSVSRFTERLSIESRPDWHRAAMRPVNLDRAEFCASCHTQTVDERLNDFGFLKIRSEYEEWFGRYTGGRGTAAGALTCRDCHMPLVPGTDPAGRDGKHRSHRFLGAHTALPAVLDYPEQVALTEQWLRGEYYPEELRDRWPEGPLIAINGQGTHTDDDASLTVHLTNIKVGHGFPAGTITFADVWVEVVVRDAHGDIVYENGVLGEDLTHTADFRLFGTLVDEHGELLTMAQTFQAVGMGEMHTIMPGYTESFTYRFTSDSPKPWTAQVKLHYRKISPRFLQFAAPEIDLARIPIVTMNEREIVFAAPPVRPASAPGGTDTDVTEAL